MTITAGHIAALRAALAGDASAFELLAGETASAYAQFMLLSELVSDLDDEQLSALLARAGDDTERAERPAPPAGRRAPFGDAQYS